MSRALLELALSLPAEKFTFRTGSEYMTLSKKVLKKTHMLALITMFNVNCEIFVATSKLKMI
jgi:hypothetical protein